ncbi:Glyoxalase superfamily enzyme, possibly 3-demethylubiquinone-9 3-methyltransferase [Flavobacteriaceae bacterium MAR_2010_188]|nr:Glyoxalase superfamily enzyme, possibly 3-demethylubiquinone-9 3-methyltransferase [Flavobacteriaceae bacterium MAR_2010_188]
MKNRIYPCLSFNDQSREASDFYLQVFKASSLSSRTDIVSILNIVGHKFMALDAGADFKPNPAMSFYTVFESEKELKQVWNSLSETGMVMMPLNKYDWSELYGWVSDKFGVSWQLSLGKRSDMGQKITPALMFVGRQFGKAEEAIDFYTTIFDDSNQIVMNRYREDDKLQAGKLVHAQFQLKGQRFIAMDSGMEHKFQFSEGNSFVVSCKNGKEIDHYWEALSAGGEKSRCGWLKDKFGLSWQIVPAELGEWMKDKDRTKRIMAKVITMDKLDYDELKNA